jgi:hypothetical protein
MPAQWHEPFGLTLIRPVSTGDRHPFRIAAGDYPASVGGLGDSVEELVDVARGIVGVDPAACRARVERYFTHRTMAEGYLRVARHYLESGVLPPGVVAGD